MFDLALQFVANFDRLFGCQTENALIQGTQSRPNGGHRFSPARRAWHAGRLDSPGARTLKQLIDVGHSEDRKIHEVGYSKLYQLRQKLADDLPAFMSKRAIADSAQLS